MSADTLRRAAALMRERAHYADDGPYIWGEASCECCVGLRATNTVLIADGVDYVNAEHLASWHPAVALAVADWLDHAARQVQAVLDDARAYDEPTRDLTADFGPALAVARRYLGDP